MFIVQGIHREVLVEQTAKILAISFQYCVGVGLCMAFLLHSLFLIR
jgi:hypothetical protein